MKFYDAFSQMTARSTTHWNLDAGFTAAFGNGRQTNPGVSYDAAGNMTHTETRPDSSRQETVYDAANRVATVTTSSLLRVGQHDTRLQTDALTQTYDGDGHGVKSQETWTTSGLPPQPPGLPKYEVWSSVLQTPLTELSNEGTKLKTKVLAGGAVIAEQVNGTGRVEWISADPVTGSSVRLHQSGVFYDDETKQLEPLGQEVLAVEPPVVEEPDPNEASAAVTTHSAGEPEWQCRAAAAAGNNFWQQPVHCQQAQIQNLNFSLEGLLSAHTENNPNRINSLHHPLPHLIMQGRLSPEERMRKKALAATDKFNNADEGDDTIYGAASGVSYVTVRAGYDFGNFSAEFGSSNSKADIKQDIKDAVAATKAILSEKSDCSGWFGSNALSALDAFGAQLVKADITRYSDDETHGIRQSLTKEQPNNKFYDTQGNETHDVNIQAYRLYPLVQISSQGPFNNLLSRTRIGNYPAASLGSRIVQILHELAHLTLRGKNGALIKNDGPGSGISSEENTNIILDEGKDKGNCRNAIEKYLKNLKKQKKR